MEKKVWYKSVIATEEQNVEIFPTEGFDGIIIQTKELNDKTYSPRLYLNKEEMELLILKMGEIMDYATKKQITMNTEKKQTAVTLLFQEFRALSEVMRKAGDEKNANLIDCLCEREDVAKQMEKEQIEIAWHDGIMGGQCGDSEQYYNETYGGTQC
jgi:hypothetical protein